MALYKYICAAQCKLSSLRRDRDKAVGVRLQLRRYLATRDSPIEITLRPQVAHRSRRALDIEVCQRACDRDRVIACVEQYRRN